MTVDRIVRIIAGMMVMLSLALGWESSPIFHHQNWLWLTGFVGLNLFQSGLTTFCPLDIILKKMGVPTCAK